MSRHKLPGRILVSPTRHGSQSPRETEGGGEETRPPLTTSAR
jgi:hypothetical protein